MPAKKWQGLRDDLSDVSDEGMLTATNVSYRIDGECRRRPGLSNRIDESGILVTEWTDPFATPYLVFNTGSGTLKTVKISDGTETTVATGLSSAYRGCYAKSNGRLYFANGFNAMRRIGSGTLTADTAGINAPDAVIGTPASTTGATTSGTHLLRYRYFDSKSLYMSDPSPAISMSVTGTQTLTFSIGAAGTNIIRSTDAKVDQIIIEMTDSASSTYYRAATVNQVLTGTTITMSDSDLVLQVTAARDGEFSHQPPPLASMVTEHRARLFAWGQNVTVLTGVALTTGASAGTASVTGSTMSSGWAGFLMLVGGDTKTYRIASMSGTAIAVLSEAYTGTAATKTGVTFFSATPDMLYWTRAGFPESWNPTSFARRVLQNQSDIPSGMHSFNEVLYLFGQRTIRGLDFASDPALGQIQQIASEMGLWNNNCLIEAAGYLWGWGRSGAWYLNGMLPVPISKRIDDTLEIDVDTTKSEQFHAVYNPRERCIMWFYCTSSDTYPQHAFCYDLDNQEMTQRSWKQGIRASCLTTGGTTDLTKAKLADANGYTWDMTNDRFDGVPSTMSGGAFTVYTGTSTVVTVSGTPFATGTSSNLIGVVAMTSTGGESVISANTANTFTVSPAFAAAPSVGSDMYLGSIPLALRSKWITFGSLDAKKRPSHVSVKMRPGTNTALIGTIKVGYYLDFSTTQHTFTKNATEIDPDGVTITNGAFTADVDFDGGSGDGVAYVPMPSNWLRSISLYATSDKPQDVMKLLDLSFVMKSGNAYVEVTDE